MSILNVDGVSFTFSGDPLLKEASMRLFIDDHAVLVGPNGHGKSTLMRLIAKELNPDSGRITWLPHIAVGYLDQFLTLNPNLVVQDYIIDVFKPLFDLEKQMIELYEKASHDGPDQMNFIHYAQ
ncbi:MAG: ATP-binding cassette domain-containing protein, partial [Acholeplasmataceae bacterium]